MITDLRPIVERILRQMLVAGLPVMMASCTEGHGTLRGSGGVGGQVSMPGSGGSGGMNSGSSGGSNAGGGGGSNVGGSNVAGQGGGGGAGGAVQDAGVPADAPIDTGLLCDPFDYQCGTAITGCGGVSGMPGSFPVNTMTMNFDPNDPRWVDLYRACVADASNASCHPDTCKDLCIAAWKNDAGVSPVTYASYLHCTLACGQPNVLTVAYQNIACGRRAGGPCLDEALESTTPALGRYLARAARLEAESVPAFARVTRALAHAGAPSALIRDARVAMADEARHWRRTRDLARKRGAEPVRPATRAPDFTSLADLALDNLVEGCVRETFGALVAAHQASTARDPDVRALMTEIAHDELAHANLSWRIDAWATEALGPAFEARRRDAATAAIGELVAGVVGIRDEDDVLRDAGLPDQEGSRALLGATWAHVWKDAFAPAT